MNLAFNAYTKPSLESFNIPESAHNIQDTREWIDVNELTISPKKLKQIKAQIAKQKAKARTKSKLPENKHAEKQDTITVIGSDQKPKKPTETKDTSEDEEDKPFKCPHCPRECHTVIQLNAHALIRHDKLVRWYNCKKCSYMHSLKSCLSAHEKKHARELQCKHCTFKTKYWTNLEYHVKTHVSLICELCPHREVKVSLIREHLSRWHPEESASRFTKGVARGSECKREVCYSGSAGFGVKCAFCSFSGKKDPTFWRHVEMNHNLVIIR